MNQTYAIANGVGVQEGNTVDCVLSSAHNTLNGTSNDGNLSSNLTNGVECAVRDTSDRTKRSSATSDTADNRHFTC